MESFLEKCKNEIKVYQSKNNEAIIFFSVLLNKWSEECSDKYFYTRINRRTFEIKNDFSTSKFDEKYFKEITDVYKNFIDELFSYHIDIEAFFHKTIIECLDLENLFLFIFKNNDNFKNGTFSKQQLKEFIISFYEKTDIFIYK